MPPQSSPSDPSSHSTGNRVRLIIFFVLIVGLASGATGFYLLGKANTPATTSYGDSTVEKSYLPYQILTASTYVDKSLGFSLAMPSSWTRYAIRVDRSWPNIIVTIGLPVQNASSTKYLGYPEENAKVIDIVHFQITPTELWKSDKGRCDGVDGPCLENDVIASSTKYIFSTLYPRPHAGWGFAQEWGASEPYIAAVWDNFDLGKSLKIFEPSIN